MRPETGKPLRPEAMMSITPMMTAEMSARRVHMTHASSTSAPILTSLARLRRAPMTMAAQPARPSSTVRLLYPVAGPISGSDPAPMTWNPSGTGTVLDLPIHWLRPRKMSMPARVTMNAGMPT